ncbi:MAG: glycosyltransferase, partial [Proteobacteria bacterium]|nr:glycosyltransferase [Pseudomonadota bacterium]
LGVNEFGNYSYVLSLATIFMVIQDGGYKTLLYRDTIDGPNKNLLPFAIYHVFIVTLFGVLVVAFLQPKHWLTILAAFFCTGLIVITIYVSSLLKGYGDFKLDAVWKLSVRILSAIGILTALFFQTNNTIFFVFIAWSISLLICLIWPMRKKYLVLPTFKFRKKIIKAGLVFLSIDLSTIIYFRSDIVMLELLGQIEGDVGQYSAAYKVLDALILMLTPIALIAFRTLRHQSKDPKKFFCTVLQHTISMFFISISFFVLASLWGYEFIIFTFGDQYVVAANLLFWLLISLFFLLPNVILTQSAIALDKEIPYAKIVSAIAIVNVLFNYFLIPIYGSLGATFSTIVAEFLLFSCLVYVLWPSYRSNKVDLDIISPPKTVRIGVDVKSLTHPLSGIGRYTSSLLQKMTLNESYDWVFYSHKPIPTSLWSKKNIIFRNLDLPEFIKGHYIFWSQLILPFWIKKDGIDLFWSPNHRLPLFLPKSVKCIVTIHDLVWKKTPQTMTVSNKILDSFFMPRSVKMADKIITVSNSTKKDLFSEMPYAIGKTETVYEAGFLFNNLKKITLKSKKYILFVGTLEPRKNLVRLLEAYALLPHYIKKEYSFYIIGNKGWGMNSIEHYINTLSIEEYVKVFGFLSDNALARAYQKASLLVMPSLYEGFGLPLVEAMNCGVPVVTSNTSSMPEVTGNASLLIDPYSINSIKEAILKVLTNKNLESKLSRNGLKQSKKYSWTKASKKTLEVFKNTLSKKTGK